MKTMENTNSSTLYFLDGKHRIDMIIAYKDDNPSYNHKGNHRPDSSQRLDAIRRVEERAVFENNLRTAGLLLEKEPSFKSADQQTNFIKISARWKTLQKYAEILKLKMPVKRFTSISYTEEPTDKDANVAEALRKCLLETCGGGFCNDDSSLFDYNSSLIPPEPDFFKVASLSSKEDRFVIKERDSVLTSTQRSLIVWQILQGTSYCNQDHCKVGINRLISKGTYHDVYPLHDGPYDKDGSHGELCTRRILYLEWAQISKWYKRQPLWMIKRYFGDKIGLYFAWLGFYTSALIPAAVVGFACFVFGLATMNTSLDSSGRQICNKTGDGNLTMCPRCDKYCDFWKLSYLCPLSKISYLFDNFGNIFFAIFISFWATIFVEMWKRKQAIIAWEWDMQNSEVDEQLRPEFELNVETKRINPVTKKHEPFLPPGQKILRCAFTYTFVAMMLLVVMAALFAVMVYQILMEILMFQATDGSWLLKYAKLIITLTASILNLIAIVLLNKVYHHVVLWLTKLEYPRTQTEFEDSYTFKVYLFQCINFYSSLAYIAFFKGRFYTHPGDGDNATGLGRFKSDVCDASSCFYELSVNFMVIMVGKQAANNFVELLLPKVTNLWNRHIYRKSAVGADDDEEKDLLSRWEKDYSLVDFGRLDIIEEYLEMVIQYGFVTLFSAAFPLAPVFALMNNIIEIRLDAYKLIATFRRPLAQTAQDIGAWLEILKVISYLSVITNSVIVAVSSDFIPKLVYQYVTGDDSLDGFIRFSLTEFNVSDWGDSSSENWMGPTLQKDDLPETCYFKAFRRPGPNYGVRPVFYHIMAAKFAFILIMEHVVFCLIWLLSLFVSDTPKDVAVQMHREELLERESLLEKADRENGGTSVFGSALLEAQDEDPFFHKTSSSTSRRKVNALSP